jgi:eukaryotic-like serine/threonine-protein kinase
MTLTPGQSIGPYQIEALAGAGAMGEVYRARDTRLNRVVAIKVLPSHVAAVPGFLQRFEREARAIAAVEHLNICPLYDVGADSGVNYLVMQYIEGETLADRIARGPMPWREAVGVAQQIAAGLDAAHQQGIVHRDLKPSNIRLTSDGQVKLVDFGLAKAVSSLSSSDPEFSPTVSASPTEAGAILGTAAYMSPEQARGQSLDKRTDIWAFGSVLYEMLTGRKAFAGATVADLLAAVIGREPDWSALRPDTPRRLRDLLRRCLQKDSARRLRDIGDARLELEDVLAEPADVPATISGRPKWLMALAWAVAALSVAALLFWRPASATRETPSVMRFSSVTNFAGVEGQPSLSPDGLHVAFVSNRDGQWDLYVGLVTSGDPIRLTNDPNLEAQPRWSPDGSKLLFSRLNDTGLQDIWVTPAFPGPARRLIQNAMTPDWSADGRIAYSDGKVIWICDADGANPRVLTKPDPIPLFHYQPAFSHSGNQVAFIRRRLGPRSELALADVKTSVVRTLTSDDALALSPVWSPDDRFIYFSSSRGGTMNVWRMTVATGEATQITAGQGDDTEVDVSADGKRLIFATYRANTNLVEISFDGSPTGQRKWLTKDLARSETGPRYSPDGKRIAYFTNRSGAEREGIWVMDADGRNPTKLFDDGRTNVYPRWSPDQQDIYFYTRYPGVVNQEGVLRRIALAGGAPQTLPVKPWFPFWGWGDVAQDGRFLLRTSETAGEWFDSRTNRTEPVPDLPGDPTFSRDGKSYAFATRVDGAGAVTNDAAGRRLTPGLRVDTPGQGRRDVFEGWVVWFAWSGNGDLFFIEGHPDLKGTLWRVTPNGTKMLVLKELPFFRRPFDGNWIARFDVHPDGRRIVVEGLESYEADIGMIEIGK